MHISTDKGDLPKLRTGLDTWLSTMFNRPFTCTGRRVPIRQQSDSYSCSIFVMNAMERAMLKCPAFEPEETHSICVQYFKDLAKYILKMVRIPVTLWIGLANPFPVAWSDCKH